MHDVLEGCVPFELKLFVNSLIDSKIITLDALNERIKFFNYGQKNQSIKPSPIVLEKSNNLIGQRAMQSWCLIMYFPLIIDDLVLTDKLERMWDVILLLLQIMSIIFSERITNEMIVHLEDLRTKHHTMFRQNFNNQNLIPKQHFMIYYPRVIRLMGPLTELWCMRFEGKHAILKDMAHKFKNFKNNAKILAFILQKRTIFDNDHLFEINYKKGPQKQIVFSNYLFKDLIKTNIDDFANDQIITIFNWVEIGFHKICMIICSAVIDNLPQFEKIVEIIMLSDCPFFITEKCITLEMVKKLHAFKVQVNKDSDLNIIDVKTLIYPEPFDLHQSTTISNFFYMVPKYKFVF